MANNMKNVDLAILKTITRVRLEHHACTARAVANQLRMSPDVVRYRCDGLKRQGLVTWSAMAGSLRVLNEELVPAASEPEPADHATDAPASEEVAGPVPEVVSADVEVNEFHCAVCDRTFQRALHLTNHLKGKAHLEAVVAQEPF